MIFDKLQKDNEDISYVFTTCSSRQEAKSIAFSVVEERLAGCADFWPISSIYPWQDVIEEVDQYMLMISTQKPLTEKLMKFIGGIHSYSIPFIVASDTRNANVLYKNWMNEILQGDNKYITSEEKIIRDKIAEEGDYHPGKLK